MKLDMATQKEEKVPRAGTRVEDPFVLTFKHTMKMLS